MDGSGNAAAGFPRLAGINAEYLAKQLHDYRDATCNNPVMQPNAKTLSDAEMKVVAACFATQRPTTLPIVRDEVFETAWP